MHAILPKKWESAQKDWEGGDAVGVPHRQESNELANIPRGVLIWIYSWPIRQKHSPYRRVYSWSPYTHAIAALRRKWLSLSTHCSVTDTFFHCLWAANSLETNDMVRNQQEEISFIFMISPTSYMYLYLSPLISNQSLNKFIIALKLLSHHYYIQFFLYLLYKLLLYL